MACVFCQIVDGSIPSHKVYEDSTYLAFLDINPVNPGHTLVVPKKHYPEILSTPDDVLSGLIVVVKKVAAGVVKGLRVEGFNLGLNNGQVAGQAVEHVHFHVMPRIEGDGHRPWQGQPYAAGEAEVVAGQIRKNI